MNTSSQNEPPQSIVLRVSFDVDQLSNRLIWVFDDDGPVAPLSNVNNAYHRFGRHAGSVHFNEGDVLSVRVLGYGRPDNFVTFSVTDATLITLPAPYLQEPPPPSPFDLEHATQELEFFDATPVHSKDKELRICAADGKTALTVVQCKGVWEFSLVLTVAILRQSGVPGAALTREVRVFQFDPESEVGTGVTR